MLNMSVEFEMRLAEWLLLVTWTIVIPYLVVFPPKLARLRRRLDNKLEAKRVRAMRLKDTWLSKKTDSPTVVVPKGQRTTLVFVNKLSGGQVGGLLRKEFEAMLHGAQIFDLSETKPEEALQTFAKNSLSSVRILVCGGDGTVNWVMEAAEKLGCRFPMAILPLGTGNDLARSINWGSGIQESDVTPAYLQKRLSSLAKSEVINLDRWQVRVDEPGGNSRIVHMNNYFSTGIDAEISCKFHQERQLHPERFTSQQHNIMKYAFYGFEGAFEGTPLGNTVRITRLDGSSIDMNPLWKGIIVSNVPCYHGGKNFWGDGHSEDRFTPSSISDGSLEVMAVAGTLHIGLINLAVDQAMRLDQCNGIKIVVPAEEEACFQVDGEPWRQPGPATITITATHSYPMLQGPQ